MRLTPSAPDIRPDDGFKPETDIFGYEAFGRRFANLVQNIDQPLTLLLEGPWGSGKSIFMRQWAGLLRQRGAAVIEFDAFANDHHEDAFVALAAEIVKVARQRLDQHDSPIENFSEKAKKVAVALMPMAAKIAIRIGTMGLFHGEEIMDGAADVAKVLADEAANAAERAVEDYLRTTRDERQVLDAFRDCLAKLAADIGMPPESQSDSKASPLVFIIDELDRCRPPFALALLERIKHLFSVPGVTFVLVTNLEQLKAAVCGAYGQDTDAHLYLEKFYDLRIVLPREREGYASQKSLYATHLFKKLDLNVSDRETENIRHAMVTIANIHRLSFRSMERVATHIALSVAASGKDGIKSAPLIVGLAVIRQINSGLYEKARAGILSWDDAQEFFKFRDWPEDTREWFTKFWRFFTDPEMTDEVIGDLYRAFGYVSYNRLELLPWGTTMMDDFSMADN